MILSLMKLKKGTTRLVLVFPGRFVIKVPQLNGWRFFLLGLLANMQEANFWTLKREQLCPVLGSDSLGFWLVMAYARPLTEVEWEAFDLKAFAEQEDYLVPVDPRYDNFGVWQERIVAIDYGS